MPSIYDLSSRKLTEEKRRAILQSAKSSELNPYDTVSVHIAINEIKSSDPKQRSVTPQNIYDCSIKR